MSKSALGGEQMKWKKIVFRLPAELRHAWACDTLFSTWNWIRLSPTLTWCIQIIMYSAVEFLSHAERWTKLDHSNCRTSCLPSFWRKAWSWGARSPCTKMDQSDDGYHSGISRIAIRGLCNFTESSCARPVGLELLWQCNHVFNIFFNEGKAVWLLCGTRYVCAAPKGWYNGSEGYMFVEEGV